MLQNLSSAAVVIGALRVKHINTGHFGHASEMLFEWCFGVGLKVARDCMEARCGK